MRAITTRGRVDRLLGIGLVAASTGACALHSAYIQRSLVPAPAEVAPQNVKVRWEQPSPCVRLGVVTVAGRAEDIAKDRFETLKRTAGKAGANTVVISFTPEGRPISERDFNNQLFGVDEKLTVFATAFSCSANP